MFHDGSRADSIGSLTYRQAAGAGTQLQNPGYAITGLGMGGDLVLNRGTTVAPDLLRFGGGITYTGFEVVEVLLGQKKETVTIDATAANVVTVVHGGGDDDTFIVLDNGGPNVVAGPLVLYGDTSQNGLLPGGRYSGASGVKSVNALGFSNPGNDTINGAGTSAVLTIFGGPGNDILAGGRCGRPDRRRHRQRLDLRPGGRRPHLRRLRVQRRHRRSHPVAPQPGAHNGGAGGREGSDARQRSHPR